MQCNPAIYEKKHLILGMVETQFPKFRWGTISEANAGHTRNEWGSKSEAKIITAYRVIWDKT